jgi:predicted nuclease with TOPRIM domain
MTAQVWTLIAVLSATVFGMVAINLHLGSRIDTLAGRLDARIDASAARLDGRMDKLDGRMDKLDGRMDKLDDRMGRSDSRMDDLIDAVRAQGKSFGDALLRPGERDRGPR